MEDTWADSDPDGTLPGTQNHVTAIREIYAAHNGCAGIRGDQDSLRQHSQTNFRVRIGRWRYGREHGDQFTQCAGKTGKQDIPVTQRSSSCIYYSHVIVELKKIDWEAIEIDYRAGIKTLRDIAEEHSITHGAINKRAKRDGWTRDLNAKIKAKAAFLVSKSLVSRTVSKEKRILESEIVEANALDSATIQINERKDVARARSVSMARAESASIELSRRIDIQKNRQEVANALGRHWDEPELTLLVLAQLGKGHAAYN